MRAQIVQMNEYKKQPRVQRSPKHSFNLKSRPYEIVPFMIAPVLPGETLDGAFMQASVVSDKIANRLIGWWNEYHLFYVPIRALTLGDYPAFSGDNLESLFLDPTFQMSSVSGAAAANNSVPFYNFKTGINWTTFCYDAVVENWFSDEGEMATRAAWDDYYIAQTDQGNLFHSLKEESAQTDEGELPGVDEVEELDILPGFTTHYAQWELMRDQGMTELSYKDYLRSYGITVPKDVMPDVDVEMAAGDLIEKIGSFRRYTQPTLAPQQGDSASASVVYWKHAERVTKRLLFTEPGFVFGVTVCRPKVYLGNQKGAGVGLLRDAFSWLPAVLSSYGYTSLQENLDSATDGILQGGDEDYWLDMKDLFLHGDQFVNFTMSVPANHGVSLPYVTTQLDKKYLTEAQMNQLFATSDGSASYLYQDGSMHLDVLGRIRDTSPKQ